MFIFIGMSIRVAQELGLHRQRPAIYTSVSRSPTNDHSASLNKTVQGSALGGVQRSDEFDEASQILLFWCVFVQDTCLANGTGRVPSIHRNEISVRLPTNHDMSIIRGDTNETSRAYAFPEMVSLMLKYAESIELLNLDNQCVRDISERRSDVDTIHDIRDRILTAYDAISEPLKYGANQYRQVAGYGEAIPYLVLHLNMHLQIAFLTQACHAIEFQLPRSSLDKQSQETIGKSSHGPVHNSASSLSHENYLYRKAIKSIVDILTIARFVDARPLLSTFFLNQSFFHAACAYAGDMLRFQHHSSQQFSAKDHNAAFPLPSPLSTSVVFDLDNVQNNSAAATILSSTDTYLALLAKTNYAFLRHSITEMSKYYAGAGWVDNVLDQRESGVRDVDLSIVSESICTYVRLHELRANHHAIAKVCTHHTISTGTDLPCRTRTKCRTVSMTNSMAVISCSPKTCCPAALPISTPKHSSTISSSQGASRGQRQGCPYPLRNLYGRQYLNDKTNVFGLGDEIGTTAVWLRSANVPS